MSIVHHLCEASSSENWLANWELKKNEAAYPSPNGRYTQDPKIDQDWRDKNNLFSKIFY